MSLEQKLQEAREELHKMTLGKSVASVEVDGQKVSYSLDTNITELRAYIARLELEIAGSASRRAIRVIF